jgi:type VI secretion system protein ImpF
MSERKIEVRTPLFDRLVDHDPRLGREERPLRTLDRGGLYESVRRELERLLNTRCPFPAHRLGGRERSVIDYGIPDFAGLSARSFADRERLAEVLRQAVAAFEPRLSEVRVRLEPVPGDDLALAGRIEALLRVGALPEPVSFVTVLQLKDGAVGVHASAE